MLFLAAATVAAAVMCARPGLHVPPCTEDLNCSLNGVCRPSDGACVCDAGWMGSACEQLDLLPMPPMPAYGWDPNVTSWGGSPVLGDDGKCV
jgi:hypothetical protein